VSNVEVSRYDKGFTRFPTLARDDPAVRPTRRARGPSLPSCAGPWLAWWSPIRRACGRANISTGPVFRPIAKGERLQEVRLTDRSVAKIIKAQAARIGLDPAVFSGHLLRSGFLTSAAARGASIFKMMDVSRHKSVDTLRGYVRDAELFRDHAGARLL